VGCGSVCSVSLSAADAWLRVPTSTSQDPPVAPAQRHPVGVEALEQRLGVAPGRTEVVAQPGEGDRPFGLDDRHNAVPHGRERLGVQVEVLPDTHRAAGLAQSGYMLVLLIAELGRGQWLVTRGPQPLLECCGARGRHDGRWLARGP